MIIIKSPHEMEYIRQACKLTADTLELLIEAVKPGVTTQELDTIAEQNIRQHGGVPSCLGYYGYPATICASVNEQVVHGIPSGRKLKDGDVISIDLVSSINGYHGDSCVTVPVGNRVNKKTMQLLKVTEEALFKGIEQAVVGNHVGDISHAVQTYAESFGYGVVRDFVGHGIGRDMHEDPQIPNYAQKRRGVRLQAGMTLAIEPMINAGTWQVRFLRDGWTVVTKDGSLSAHYENTILVTDGEPEILTLY